MRGMGGPRASSGYSLDAANSAKVAERVRALMRDKGLTQLALAGVTGVPQGHISNLLNGSKRFQQWQVKAFADALDVREGDLLPPGLFEPATEPAASVQRPAMSARERKLQASKEAYLARFAAELGPLDVEHVKAVVFITDPGMPEPDDQYWWDTVESGRRRRERARLRGGNGGKPSK